MGNDLDESPLFDDRHIMFLQSILYGIPKNPISGIEQNFLKHSLLIVNLDEHFDGQLITKLNQYKKHVSVQTSIRFLLEARRHDMLDSAIEILETAIKEKTGGDYRQLIRTLKEMSDNTPASWAILLHGEQDNDRVAESIPQEKSGLNLTAMKNFR